MTHASRGRITPSSPPPFKKGARAEFKGAYPWNAPKEPVSRERLLTREEYLQGQAVLSKLATLPRFLRAIFTNRYERIKKSEGQMAGLRFLTNVVMGRLWPRIEKVNGRHGLKDSESLRFLTEADAYRWLPDMSNRAIEKMAGRIAGQLRVAYEELSDAYLAAYGGDRAALFTDAAQVEFYGHLATCARALNVTPVHWKAYKRGKLNMRCALAAVERLVRDDWWKGQLKAQRDKWREALLIAVSEVNRQRSPYASRQAIRDVQARRLSNMDYLKSCELENVATGERIDLLDKVMASISNPEIRRMELMSTVAGIQKYADDAGHVGLFITITTPSKYHPTRVTSANKIVQLNHRWDDEAYSPKDGQRYLCGIWSKMRTAFKDNGLRVYGIRVVEPHHDATPHWHMMLFCERKQRAQIIDIMRRYSLAEDGDERGAQANRFECKHLNKGGAAGYIAKYIAKNIDGYALAGEIDNDTGKPLSDTAAAVTAWASTWRIPQFKTIGVPTMGAYRECRRVRNINLSNTFDEQVEAVRAAADVGDFAAYIAAQGGANVPRDMQTVRVARRVADELNDYNEEVTKVVGIFAPHLGYSHVHETRAIEWRIVPKSLDLNQLTLKSGFAAPRSSVNNCGEGQDGDGDERVIKASERAAIALKLIDDGVIDWGDAEAATALKDAVREGKTKVSRLQRSYDPYQIKEVAPSARLTGPEQDRLWRIQSDLSRQGIKPESWELAALARGATVIFEGRAFTFPPPPSWGGFNDIEGSFYENS